MGALQPIDVLVALKLAATAESEALPVRGLAAALGVPKSTVELALRRLTVHGVISPGSRRINRLALRELIEKGCRWIAPARIGGFVLGIPTAHSASPIAEKLLGDLEPVVMPFPEGPVRGRELAPIHPLAPAAVAHDERLRELLVITDVFRIGRAREKEIAANELRARV